MGMEKEAVSPKLIENAAMRRLKVISNLILTGDTDLGLNMLLKTRKQLRGMPSIKMSPGTSNALKTVEDSSNKLLNMNRSNSLVPKHAGYFDKGLQYGAGLLNKGKAFAGKILPTIKANPVASGAIIGAPTLGIANIIKQKGEIYSGRQDRVDPYRVFRAGMGGAMLGAGGVFGAMNAKPLISKMGDNPISRSMKNMENASASLADTAGKTKDRFYGLFSRRP